MRLKMIRNDPNEPIDDLIRANETNWSAIFSGAFLTAGMGFFFLLLGNAVGLNVAHIGAVGDGAVRFWSWVYLAVTAIFSFFAGPLMANRLHGIRYRTHGAIHGLVSWGLATVIVGGLGLMASVGAKSVTFGTGVDAANWLAVCIIGFGAFASMAGGSLGRIALMSGKYELDNETVTPSESEKVEKKQIA